jgi:hypothetical protein
MPERIENKLVGTCPSCGDVSLVSDDLELWVCSRRVASYYRFTCPLCRNLIVKHAGDQVMNLLTGAGVVLLTWFYPAEWDEEHSGPPLTNDDLLDLHLSLQ